jgi:two-component sensor histidine kinase
MDEAEGARLRETEHRVKNTLQLISSIVMLQSRRTPEPATQAALKAVLQRITAVSLAHRHIADERIELAALIRELAAELTRAIGREGVEVKLDLEPITVAARHAAPIALWANEALGNALNHGFPHGRPGRVLVTLRRTPEGLELAVSDDGVGLAEPAKGFGATLLQLMAQQLKGRLEITPQPGCRVAVTVPVEAA